MCIKCTLHITALFCKRPQALLRICNCVSLTKASVLLKTEQAASDLWRFLTGVSVLNRAGRSRIAQPLCIKLPKPFRTLQQIFRPVFIFSSQQMECSWLAVIYSSCAALALAVLNVDKLFYAHFMLRIVKGDMATCNWGGYDWSDRVWNTGIVLQCPYLSIYWLLTKTAQKHMPFHFSSHLFLIPIYIMWQPHHENSNITSI